MNTEPAPYYQQPTQPQKKQRSGCLTALLIFLALGLVTMVIGAFVAWKLYQNPAVQAAVDAGLDVPNAPGRAELERAGCQNAMIVDLRALGKLAEGRKEPSEDIKALKDSVLIVCLAAPHLRAPSPARRSPRRTQPQCPKVPTACTSSCSALRRRRLSAAASTTEPAPTWASRILNSPGLTTLTTHVERQNTACYKQVAWSQTPSPATH